MNITNTVRLLLLLVQFFIPGTYVKSVGPLNMRE